MMKFDHGISVKNWHTHQISYEKAMDKAFSEIFQNLKEIEKDRRLQRKKGDLDWSRRRGSAPARTLTETAGAVFKTPKDELRRQLSSPVCTERISPQDHCSRREQSTQLTSSSRTMHWVLTCCEEDDD